MGRLLAISDIHGHGDGLRKLLQTANYRPEEDTLVMLGDYIDAASPHEETLKLVMELVSAGAAGILGNQELRYLHQYDGKKEHASYVAMFRRMPLFYERSGILFVHAGIHPGKGLQEQDSKDLTEIREPFFAAADRYSYPILFGHTPTFRLGAVPGNLWRKGKLVGIDTGAKHRMRLTLVNLSEGVSYSCATSEISLYGDVVIRKEAVLSKLWTASS